MTYSKYAFIPIGFFIILILNIVIAIGYYERTQPYIEEMKTEGKLHSPLKSKRTKYLYTIGVTGSIYFFLLIFSGGFFLFEKNNSEDIAEKNKANWWWQIYLGLWFLILLVVLQLLLVPHLPYHVQMPLSDKCIGVFIFKGLVLIPAAGRNSNLIKAQQNKFISYLILIELILALSLLFFLNILEEMGSFYDDDF